MGLKILMILYSVPKCSLSMGPISLPLLLASNKIFLLWFFVSPASGFTLFSTCFKKPVPCWTMCSTVNPLLRLTLCTSSAENLRSLDLKFFGWDQFRKSSEMSRSLILLLLFLAFKELISFPATFNSCSRYLILPFWYLACFWYLHDIRSDGMLLSIKLGLVFAQYMWKHQLQLLHIKPLVTKLRHANTSLGDFLKTFYVLSRF